MIYRIDSYDERLVSSLIRAVERKREQLLSLSDREVIKNPMAILTKSKELIDGYCEVLIRSVKNAVKDKKSELLLLAGKLNALSPLSVLERGYAIVEYNSERVKSVDCLSVGDKVEVRLSDGNLLASVDGLTKKKGNG